MLASIKNMTSSTRPEVHNVLHYLWPSYVTGQAIYIFILLFVLLYGRPTEQGRPLYLCPVVSFYGRPAQQMRTLYFVRFLSSGSILFFSGRRLDVYHITSTYGVALVRI